MVAAFFIPAGLRHLIVTASGKDLFFFANDRHHFRRKSFLSVGILDNATVLLKRLCLVV